MKAFVRRHFEDFVNNQRAEMVRENMAPDFLDHNGPGDREVGIAEDEQMMLGMYKRMPGITVTIEDMVAEDDRVVCRNVWRVEGRGREWHGVPRICAVAFRGRQDRRALGDRDDAAAGDVRVAKRASR